MYYALSPLSSTYTINNHWWNHRTEVLNTMTPTEKNNMKKDEDVFGVETGGGAELNLILLSFEWSSGCCCVDLTVSLVVISLWVLQWSTNHACANSSQYILHVCSGQTFVSCPRILPFTSFREMDLYFPAHWPGYYYKWEGNNIGWTAGSACNLLHICPFHGRLWARDLVHSLFPPGGRTVYRSIHQHLFQGI